MAAIIAICWLLAVWTIVLWFSVLFGKNIH